MKKRTLYKYAVDMFCETLKKVSNRPNFTYRCNDADSRCWDNFVEEFGLNIGEDFVTKFIKYGFHSWFNDDSPKDYSHSIRFSWVFGKEAIKRWRSNNVETNLFIIRKSHLREKMIVNTSTSRERQSIITTVRKAEENMKSMYFNTERGFAWCVANTTLYHHKSIKCCACKWRNDCKDILKKNYPIIFKKRGYE